MTPTDTPTMTVEDAISCICDIIAERKNDLQRKGSLASAASVVKEGTDAIVALRAALAAKDAEIAQLREALVTAMQYMPHGERYEGPLRLLPRDEEALDQCSAALKANQWPLAS